MRRFFVKDHHLIKDGDMAGHIDSNVLDATELDYLAVEASWSGSSPSGSLRLEGSITGNTWGLITTIGAVSGNSGSVIAQSTTNTTVVSRVIPYSKVRVRYERTSGTGTLQVHISGKAN